jgi:cysteine-rich repeat protein
VKQLKPKWLVAIGLVGVAAVSAGGWALSGRPFPFSGTGHENEQWSVVASCDDQPNGTLCGEAGSGMFCAFDDCIKNACGDLIVGSGEECDDGNLGNSDGCNADCRWEPLVNCGNGVKDSPNEECDDGNLNDKDRCTVRCTIARCGDGAEGPGEECDDGNIDDTDECTAQCRPPAPSQALAAADARGGASADGKLRGARAGGSDAPGAAGQAAGSADDEGRGGAVRGSAGVSGSNVGAPSGASTANGTDAGDPDDPESQCQACREKHCRNVLGTDVLAGCLESINSAYGAPANDTSFLQTCEEVVDCARESQCAYKAARQAAPCYCGSISVDECVERGPAKDAPCVKEWQLATRSTVNMEVLQRFSDPAYPAGWAYLLLDCDRIHCRECQTL